jgi:hypothetical protein
VALRRRSDRPFPLETTPHGMRMGRSLSRSNGGFGAVLACASEWT